MQRKTGKKELRYFNIKGEHKELFGTYLKTDLSDNLTLISVFGQLCYGNSQLTNRLYTNYDALNSVLKALNLTDDKRNKYAPEYFACEEAGGNWDIVDAMLKKYDIRIARDYSKVK